jgi:DNA-binding response OmpR family regulator
MNRFSNKTILIADDLTSNRKILEFLLEKRGYRTIGVNSGYDCLKEARNGKPNLLLLDIMMPDISGIDVCKRLRADSATAMIPIIFVTAATDDLTLSKAFDAGGNDYIKKPINGIELIKRVQAVFEQEKFIETNREEEKLRSVLSMSGTICHELNQPLQFISGNCQLLLMDLEKGSPAYNRVIKMKEQIDRLSDMTKKLTHISRVETRSYVGDTKILSIGK